MTNLSMGTFLSENPSPAKTSPVVVRFPNHGKVSQSWVWRTRRWRCMESIAVGSNGVRRPWSCVSHTHRWCPLPPPRRAGRCILTLDGAGADGEATASPCWKTSKERFPPRFYPSKIHARASPRLGSDVRNRMSVASAIASRCDRRRLAGAGKTHLPRYDLPDAPCRCLPTLVVYRRAPPATRHLLSRRLSTSGLFVSSMLHFCPSCLCDRRLRAIGGRLIQVQKHADAPRPGHWKRTS